MSFAKNVNKYYKWVLGSIVAVMALSLVVSGQINLDGTDPDKHVATIFGSVKVTDREWQAARAKSGAWHRLKIVQKFDDSSDPQEQQYARYLFEMRGQPGILATIPQFQPNGDALVAATKELIVLGHEAKTKQVRVTDEEVTTVLTGYLDRAGVDRNDHDAMSMFAQQYFLATPDALRAAVRDSLLIQKSVALDVGGCNTRYEDIFGEKMASSRSVRVAVLAVDGTKLPREIRPITDEDIRARFEQDRGTYKMPAKIQAEYLFVSYDELKSKYPEPTTEEIQKYYDDRKQDYIKKPDAGHSDDDGHKHETEYKPLAEVRDDVVKKIKEKKAAREAEEIIKRVASKEFSGRWYKFMEEERAKEPKDPKSVRERAAARTGGVFAEIRDVLKAEKIEIKNGITLPIDKEDREALTLELGKPVVGDRADTLEWAFNAGLGEVGNQIYRSDKGVALIRVANKIEGYETDLTAPIREKIRQELSSQDPSNRARLLANDLEQRIRKNGKAEIEKLRGRTDVTVQTSQYLNLGSPDAESGLVPPLLAQQIKGKFLRKSESGMPKPPSTDAAEVQVITGDLVGGDRKDWCYVVVVDDEVQVAPDVKDEEFLSDVVRREALEVAKQREERMTLTMRTAEWRDADAPPPPPEE
jgi:hypothetical protein